MTGDDREAEAAAVLSECSAALAARGGTIAGDAVGAGAGGTVDWRHYPAGEIYDPQTHVQYFYHRHPAGPGPADGGHFHLFLRGDGMPAGVAPLVLADNAVANAPRPAQSAPLKRGRRDELCHLVAIALDGGGGTPIRLFTTNRWVTGETWYRADDVIPMLDRVRFRRARPPALLDRWIAAMVAVFRPEIAVLLRRRDKAVADWRWRWPRANAFEDPRLEVTSSCDIDVAARLAAIAARRAAAPAIPAPRGRRPLPAMAEGWGS